LKQKNKPNRTQTKKTRKKPSQTGKKRAKTESNQKIEPNQKVKPEKTEPNRFEPVFIQKTEPNRIETDRFESVSIFFNSVWLFFFIKIKPNKR